MPWVWDVGPLISPGKGDQVLRPVEVFGINDRTVICSDRHDALGYKLLLLLVFKDGSPTKYGGYGLGGVMVG